MPAPFERLLVASLLLAGTAGTAAEPVGTASILFIGNSRGAWLFS